jgi:hypothetical protein
MEKDNAQNVNFIALLHQVSLISHTIFSFNSVVENRFSFSGGKGTELFKVALHKLHKARFFSRESRAALAQ